MHKAIEMILKERKPKEYFFQTLSETPWSKIYQRRSGNLMLFMFIFILSSAGNNHLVKCTGVVGGSCIGWIDIRVPTLIPKIVFTGPFLNGFFTVEELEKGRCSVVEGLFPLFEGNSNEQLGRRENVRVFGVKDEPDNLLDNYGCCG